MLAALKFSHTKNPRPGSTQTKYAMWDLEDLDGIVRCIIWPEQFAEFGPLVKAEAVVAIRATIDRRPGSEEVNLIVQELIPLEELSARFSNSVLIRVRESIRTAMCWHRFAKSCAATRGTNRFGCGWSWPLAAW